MEKKNTTIRINGNDYTISGYETEEYMQRVAIYVNKKLNEVKRNCFSLDTTMQAILTAINLADENIKLSDNVSELQTMLESATEEITRLKRGTSPAAEKPDMKRKPR